MGSNVEREKIKSVYPKSEKWAKKVDKMTDSQVVAILMRFKLDGKL